MSHNDFILLFGSQISYTSVLYYLFLPAAVLVYYLFPKKHRWIILLAASCLFYYWLFQKHKQMAVFAASVLISWLSGIIISKANKHRKAALVAGIILSALQLFASDGNKLLLSVSGERYRIRNLIVPVGLSFYTLQMIAYLADIYQKKIIPEKNPLKYALFISFFPQLIQGPIPRFKDLQHLLTDGNEFNPDNIRGGFQLILWGFFLKFMIADKAGVVVNTVFNNKDAYAGCYFLIAGILYSIQLYTDFMACTTLSQGAAKLFGITLDENFNHPYFSTSIKDFWHRWHISLSYWLRDYIYIPLGGNRKGKLRKNINLVLTFVVSGLWHGGTLKFLFWGLLHAFYQIIGGLTIKPRDKVYAMLGMNDHSRVKHALRVLGTCFLAMLGWIIFRADRLKTGLSMIKSIFTVFNPWVLTGNYLFNLGLNQSEWTILMLAVILLFFVSHTQEKGTVIGQKLSSMNIILRYAIYLAAIAVIWIFGTYGFGFSAQDFIYGGF